MMWCAPVCTCTTEKPSMLAFETGTTPSKRQNAPVTLIVGTPGGVRPNLCHVVPGDGGLGIGWTAGERRDPAYAGVTLVPSGGRLARALVSP
jgi:hypothetical protein